MPRALWKGAMTFGLVYIPVQLQSAIQHGELDLDMLDRRDFSPVGYQRFNKATGKPVEWNDIVKGYEYKKGEYVALSDEDFRQANVKASQTIDIQSFAELADIEPRYYETPYFVAPTKGGEKVYALLREVLLKTGRVAIATVVIRTRQHLCAIVPDKKALMLNTLRFAHELRSVSDAELPTLNAKSLGLGAKELAMAEKLVEEMSAPFQPEQFHDSYKEDLLKKIKEKVRKKQTHTLTPDTKPEKKSGGAEIIDLMAILKRSIEDTGSKPASGRRAASSGRRKSTPTRATRGRKRA